MKRYLTAPVLIVSANLAATALVAATAFLAAPAFASGYGPQPLFAPLASASVCAR
jgi:hypothetical protein